MPDTISWRDPAGTVTVLTNSGPGGLYMGQGPVGMEMPTYAFVEDTVPTQPGTVVRQVTPKARDFDVPLVINAVDEPTAEQLVRTLEQAFDPTRGDGYLVVTATDGAQRQIPCRYHGGLEGDYSVGQLGSDRGAGGFRNFRKYLLAFHASDPYWQDLSDTAFQWNVANLRGFFSGPFLPFTLSGSSVSGTVSITNHGDVSAWPVWTITGPGANISVVNNTTGLSFDLNAAGGYTLLAGHYLTVDGRPYFNQVYLDGNTANNLYPDFEGSFFPLAVGTNSVTVTMSGAISVSSVLLTFRQKYNGKP